MRVPSRIPLATALYPSSTQAQAVALFNRGAADYCPLFVRMAHICMTKAAPSLCSISMEASSPVALGMMTPEVNQTQNAST